MNSIGYENMDLQNIKIPKITDSKKFEELIKDLIKSDKDLENINLHGRQGQKQDGIDIFASRVSNKKWIGIQCKVISTINSLSKIKLICEIKKTLNFKPKISEYHFYITLNRDNKIQEFEREINNENEHNINFKIFFWDDIEESLKRNENIIVYYRYYHAFFADNITLGHTIGKFVKLDLQFDNKSDTRYLLIIGKIPNYESKNKSEANYYSNSYYVINIFEKKIEFFTKMGEKKLSCFPSDIENAFNNKIDCYRISKWLMEIEDIDDFIYNEQFNYNYSITSAEREEFSKNNDN